MSGIPIGDFEELLGDARELIDAAPRSHFDAVAGFWATPFRDGRLSPKHKQLVALAVHASPATLNPAGLEAHVRRARDAGASDAEIIDVLISISALGNHTFAVAVPALLAVLREDQGEAAAELPPMAEEAQRIKEAFVAKRGYWTEQRETLARLLPDFFKAYMALSAEPWDCGALEPKVRELVYIAIDCAITHMHEPGLRIHIRNALKLGATREEILEVFEIAATLGASAYIAGLRAMQADAGRT